MTMQAADSKLRMIVLSAVATAALAMFVVCSLASLNHNDFMYALVPATWAQHGALYTDVPFVQAPLSALFNSLLVAITGDVNFFVPGRVASIVMVLLAVLLPVLNRDRLRDPVIWVLVVALCLTNLFIVANSSEIGNYAISLLCLSAAVTLLNASGPALWRGFAACVCAGLAVSAKLYFILVFPGLLFFFLLNDRTARGSAVLAACAFGFLIGLAPVLFFLARDYHSFLRWNVQIHQLILPTRVSDFATGFWRIEKFLATFAALMVIPIGFVVAGAVKAWRRGGPELLGEFGKLLLLGAAAVMAISPIYVFEQYLGPLALLLFLFSAPWHATGQPRRLYVVLAGVMLCMQAAIMVQTIAKYVAPDGNLQVVQVVKLQDNARRVVGAGYRCARKLYSSQPLFLLENGVQYPPELAAGPFLMFLRGGAVPRDAQFDLDAHVATWDPDVLIWGYYLDSHDPNEAAVDSFIRDYASSHGFEIETIGQIEGRRISLGTRAGCKPARGL